MKILTAEKMRQLDRLTVEVCGIPFDLLMETAGERVTEVIEKDLRRRGGEISGARFFVCCGRGNNGGDGAVIARKLWMRGARMVAVVLLGSVEEMKGEAAGMMRIVRRLAEVEERASGEDKRISFEEWHGVEGVGKAEGSDLIVDAIFGTGLARPATGIAAKAIESIEMARQAGSRVISVDVPSGLSADLSEPIGVHVRADLTVSFTAPKPGNILMPATSANGELIIAPIGTPDWLIEKDLAASGESLELIEEGFVAGWLRESKRVATAHKGSIGNVLLIAGSRGKTGAAALAAETVLRAGAGLVTVATPQSALDPLVGQVCQEVMTEPLTESAEGGISSGALDNLIRLAVGRSAIAIGPGLSSSEYETRNVIRSFVSRDAGGGNPSIPIIIDADGLNSLAPWPANIRGEVNRPIVVTPHPGEMARLTGLTTSEVQRERSGVARDFARAHNLIVVLKGARTVIADPDGRVFINPTGNPGMATAGAGDVLAGLLAGLIASLKDYSEMAVLDAVIAGVYLHGLAGDMAAAALGERYMLASDIRHYLSDAFLQIGGKSEKETQSGILTI